MSQFDAVSSVTLAGIALSATPGPSMLYVLSRSVGQGRAAGVASAVGLCLGGIILAIATAMGLAVLFGKYAWLVTGLRYVGSAYLIWLGVSMIRSARSQAQVSLEAKPVIRESLSVIIWQGILVEMLNPKTVLFFALFLPPFVSAAGGQPTEGNVKMQLLLLGILVPLTAIPSDIFVAFMGGTMAKTINRASVLRERLAWLGGIMLIGIALNLHIDLL
jgi:threonine/homoserine/homoserine lactone efflux protein